MKKYSVYVKFQNGKDLQFETISNVRKLKPFIVNNQPLIMTKDEYVMNLNHVKEIDQVELN